MRRFDPTKDAFNTKQVRNLVGATVREINYWDKKGVVRPSIRPAMGRGSQRLYSYADLLAFKTVKSLRDQGVSLQKIRKCVRYLRKNLPDISRPLTFCSLLTDGVTVYLIRDEKTLIDTVKRQGQMAFLQLSISAFDRELRGRVVQLFSKRIEEVTVGDENYQVEIESDRDSGGFIGTVPGLEGCITDGDTLEEVVENVVDAIEGWLEAHEELERRGIHVPKKRPVRKKVRA